MGRRKKPTGANSAAGANKTPNAYVMALLTALLAGSFSVIGGYFIASFQARFAIGQKHLELRAQAYSSFLEKVDRVRSPIVAELLNIGSLSEHVATDSEIQTLEDRLGEFLKANEKQTIYWQLNSDFNVLRIFGTVRTQQLCEDILKLLVLRDHAVNWSQYSRSVQEYYLKWRKIQDEGESSYTEDRISSNERLMVIMMAKLFGVLVTQLRSELSDQSYEKP